MAGLLPGISTGGGGLSNQEDTRSAATAGAITVGGLTFAPKSSLSDSIKWIGLGLVGVVALKIWKG